MLCLLRFKYHIVPVTFFQSGSTPEANPPLLAFWMSRENNVTEQPNKDSVAAKNNNSSKQKGKEFRTPSRRPRLVEQHTCIRAVCRILLGWARAPEA